MEVTPHNEVESPTRQMAAPPPIIAIPDPAAPTELRMVAATGEIVCVPVEVDPVISLTSQPSMGSVKVQVSSVVDVTLTIPLFGKAVPVVSEVAAVIRGRNPTGPTRLSSWSRAN